jgi:hypothetical protein
MHMLMLLQRMPVGHFLHVTIPPHPSLCVPQAQPLLAHVLGTHVPPLLAPVPLPLLLPLVPLPLPLLAGTGHIVARIASVRRAHVAAEDRD